MSKIIKRGDAIRVSFDTVWRGDSVDSASIARIDGHVSVVDHRTNISVQSLEADFSPGDIVKHRQTGAVRVFEPTGFRILQSKHYPRGKFFQYEPGWDLHNFTAAKWELVASLG